MNVEIIDSGRGPVAARWTRWSFYWGATLLQVSTQIVTVSMSLVKAPVWLIQYL
jgi:hypothetical protein